MLVDLSYPLIGITFQGNRSIRKLCDPPFKFHYKIQKLICDNFRPLIFREPIRPPKF